MVCQMIRKVRVMIQVTDLPRVLLMDIKYSDANKDVLSVVFQRSTPSPELIKPNLKPTVSLSAAFQETIRVLTDELSCKKDHLLGLMKIIIGKIIQLVLVWLATVTLNHKLRRRILTSSRGRRNEETTEEAVDTAVETVETVE